MRLRATLPGASGLRIEVVGPGIDESASNGLSGLVARGAPAARAFSTPVAEAAAPAAVAAMPFSMFRRSILDDIPPSNERRPANQRGKCSSRPTKKRSPTPAPLVRFRGVRWLDRVPPDVDEDMAADVRVDLELCRRRERHHHVGQV